MKKILFLFLSTLLLTGCYTSSYLKTIDAQVGDTPSETIAATDAGKIEIFCLDSISRNYKVIGKVMASADAGEDANESIKHLKDEAASIGADAIIGLRLQFSGGYWSIAIKSTGTAIKYTNK